MATWSTKYPLNISPFGTNRQEGFEKHVLEFTEVYNYLNLVRKAQADTVAPTAPETNDLWLDTGSTPAVYKYWNGTAWAAIEASPALHTSTHDYGGTDELDLSGYPVVSFTGGTFTGAINEAFANTVTAAATTDIASVTGNIVIVTGTIATGGINSFGAIAAGARRTVLFNSVVQLTYNATSMILPTRANITTATGDIASFASIATGNWVCLHYQKWNGEPLTIAAATGMILQVLQAQKTNTGTYTSNSFVDVTGLSVAITPSSANNKIKVTADLHFGDSDNKTSFAKIVRDSTDIAVGDAAGSRIRATMGTRDMAHGGDMTKTWLDSPSTTGTVTYKIQVSSEGGGTVYINRGGSDADSDAAYCGRYVSTLTVEEVKG